MEGLQVVREMVPILGSKSFDKVLCAVNPLLVSAGLELRICICEVLDGLALCDSSFTVLVRYLMYYLLQLKELSEIQLCITITSSSDG
jgi:U3 small nucleolar RNA-associated protein 20